MVTPKQPTQEAKRPGPSASSKATKDPLSFNTSLERVYTDAGQIQDNITLTILDGNQFWFVLPDGILPNNPEADVSVPYLRFTVEGRRAAMLTRMMFSRDGGVMTDGTAGKKLLVSFQPCILVSRNKEGQSIVRQLEEVDGVPVIRDDPAPPPEPEGTRIPDIGELLDGLQQTRKSLDTIDTLLTQPDALLTDDEAQRQELQQSIAATKDKALIGLGQLGEVLARGGEQSLEEWRAGVSAALHATLEAMVAFEDMSDHVRDEKRREMEALRQSIESYFATIDPKIDIEACRKFSTGVNELILEERKDTLTTKKVRLEKHIEHSYDHIISSLQQTLGKGGSLPLIPHPIAEPAPGYTAKFVFNMIHVVMAVRFGGLSIRLDTERHPRLHSDLRGWNAAHPPRIHVVDRRRFDRAVKSLKTQKSSLPDFE
jgi:hypothetical protein